MTTLRLILSSFILTAVLAAILPAQAQDTAPAERTEEITVGYRTTPPFVMRGDNGEIGGMAAELWKRIAEGVQLSSRYVEYDTVADLLAATAAGEVDVAVGAISITEDRAEKVDFTQPWFDSGLRIMVDNTAASSLGNIWNGLAEAGYLKYYAWLVGLVLLGTIGLTVFDRRFDKNFPTRWRDGVAESFYSVMLVVTKGTLPSRSRLFGWYGRLFSALWLIVGIAAVAYVTSSVTSVMTSIAISSGIDGPEDLPSRTVGVFRGSTAENLMLQQGVQLVTYLDIETAVDGLRNNDIDAFVGDSPVLEYYKFRNPDLGLDVIGPLFSPEKYGFALPYADNSRIYPITLRLLALQEEGVVDEIADDYFGDER
ncbi:MAG: ABC transporter substrate-binding protein [Rhizobiales bacterium]|nr:ABC transporter substrate-binding protein [Hyphomicrobiales bacterium]|tara:strand:- start:834 stop:1940 length:1107 start_codon:yes stop_codon:yes gene_type:complete